MKTLKKLYLTLFIAHFSFVAYAQWVQQNSNTSAWLKDLYCINVDTCFAVGWSGTVLKTVDGGNNWILQNSGIAGTEVLQAIYCINENTCITAEDWIYKTTDGGNNWVAKYDPNGTVLSIFFVNDSVGYATGDIWKTTDAGETWNWSGILGPTGGVNAVYFTDENTGYAVENYFPDGRIWKTTNGGNNWIQIYIVSDSALNDLFDVFFVNDTLGFVVGLNGVILKTTDAGINWSYLNSGTANALKSIYCIDANICYAAGVVGTILKTVDGGNTWAYDTVGVIISTYNAIFFPSSNVGFAVADGGVIIKTSNTTSIDDVNNRKLKINIYPNPFKESATIYMNNIKLKDQSSLLFELYDILGRKIKEINLNNPKTKLSGNNLKSGVYIYKITIDKYLLVIGKLIVK